MAERFEPRSGEAPRPRPGDPFGLGLPLDNHQFARLEQLRDLTRDAFGGWGRESGSTPDFFVVIGLTRYYGPTFHTAIGAALRAHEGPGHA